MTATGPRGRVLYIHTAKHGMLNISHHHVVRYPSPPDMSLTTCHVCYAPRYQYVCTTERDPPPRSLGPGPVHLIYLSIANRLEAELLDKRRAPSRTSYRALLGAGCVSMRIPAVPAGRFGYDAQQQ
eukprot:6836073-Prymnesium_polylepis.3